MGLPGSRSPTRPRRTALRDRAHGLVLTDDALLEALLHLEELVGLALEHLRDTGMPVQSPSICATSLFGDDARHAFLERPRFSTASSAASRRASTSGMVTCSSSPSFAKFCSLRASSSAACELRRSSLRSARTAPRARRAATRAWRASRRPWARARRSPRRAAPASCTLIVVDVVERAGELRLERRERGGSRRPRRRARRRSRRACGAAASSSEIDRAVGQRAVLHVALGEAHGRDDRAGRRSAPGGAPRSASRSPRRISIAPLDASAARSVSTVKRRSRLAILVGDLAHALGRGRREQADLAAREQRLQEIADAAARARPGRAATRAAAT